MNGRQNCSVIMPQDCPTLPEGTRLSNLVLEYQSALCLMTGVSVSAGAMIRAIVYGPQPTYELLASVIWWATTTVLFFCWLSSLGYTNPRVVSAFERRGFLLAWLVTFVGLVFWEIKYLW